ncbi:hypothetical protein DEO72_LG3g62 [Vigna unguiculata]|uniref:Uncharacterized protein n=1 Tax=Vigna unguiculata TaxID=3917 RepID=A0A4D6LAI1_VIGUN|nr:hypothetical protein DEO72_LG3g62 [Vigna unguiculata]
MLGPTPLQLQILERIFDEGNGTPSKQKIKEITIQLGQHGQISETHVYNSGSKTEGLIRRGSNSLPHRSLKPRQKLSLQERKRYASRAFRLLKDMYIHNPNLEFDQLLSKIEVAGCYRSYFL